MKQNLATFILSFLIFPVNHLFAQDAGHHFVLVSGYASASENAIQVCDFNEKDGSLSVKSLSGGIPNPSYAAYNKKRDLIYMVSEEGKEGGSVFCFRFDRSTAKLALVNQSSSGGEGPCYISLDKSASHIFIANYSSGSVAAIKLRNDGSLDSSTLQSIQHTGSSITRDQKGPHAHSAILAPDNNFLLNADLGNDRIYIYRYNSNSSKSLSPASPEYVSVKAGSGPRHICFHPNGKYMYVVNEISGSVDAFDYANGTIKLKQAVTMLPENFDSTVEAADIHIAPDGKFLYASNREVRNEIVIYSINKKGILNFVGRQSVLGSAPRNFVIDPSGKFLLVANLKNNEVLVFRRNIKTGKLTFIGNRISAIQPACLKFLE